MMRAVKLDDINTSWNLALKFVLPLLDPIGSLWGILIFWIHLHEGEDTVVSLR